MSKKLSLILSLVLVLALAVSASAEETLLASYEKSDAAAGLKVGINKASNSPSDLVIWPMLQGKDASSYNTKVGPGVIVPSATDGNSVLGLFWTDESSGRVDLQHNWTTPADLVKNDKILIDVYIPGPNGIPGTIELWDGDLAWLLGHHDLIETGKWFTVTFDLNELQDIGKRKTDQLQFTTIYFMGVPTKDGKAFFDNLRLESAPPAEPAATEEKQ
ncbi:MAG: hypothetical protein PHY02_01575 [Phycisphaerae bacterium]|nr:hypothetical protein [Phycisphaerae bacterium]